MGVPHVDRRGVTHDVDGAGTAQASIASDAPSSVAPCIVVRPDDRAEPATVEGVLTDAAESASGARSPGLSGPFSIHLSRPRCIVGLAHASYVTDVAVATPDADLRPFLYARVRVTGDAIGGTTDLGGPAVAILARDVTRLQDTPAAK
jgi:hypothetical protein